MCIRPLPRVLFLSCHLPWPAISGGRRREWELLRRLGERFEIHLLVVSKTYEQDLAASPHLEPFCAAVDVMAAEAAENPGGRPLRLLERHHCSDARRRVSELLGQRSFDLLHVEGFYLMQHLPEDFPVPTLVVEQNVEYELERQRARLAAPAVTDLEGFSAFLATRASEIACWRRASRLGCLTAEDRETIVSAAPDVEVSLLPNGADHVPLREWDGQDAGGSGSGEKRSLAVGPSSGDGRAMIVFAANFAYAPNVDAARHFCRAVLPDIVRDEPRARVWLVGNDPPAEVRELAGEHVEVTGTVPDTTAYLDAADVAVCPLRIGGGIKVKTIEALRRGKALVSTSIGVQGLPPAAREAVVVADEPDEFSRSVLNLLADSSARRRLERQAIAAGAQFPTWDQAAALLAGVYGELIGMASREPAVAGSARPIQPVRSRA